MQPKYMILNKRTGYTQFEHDTVKSARTEAERLASNNPNDTFVILKQIAQCEVNIFQWDFVENNQDDEIPF